MTVAFFCEALGGPVHYRGRDMQIAHAGLRSSASDWQVFVQHTPATLDTFGVSGKDREDFLAVVVSLKGDMVESP